MYDIIIIGAGTAGISAYKEAIKHTQNILIVNDGPWDTTCARVGCMPSKVLISSANRAYEIQSTSNLGLSVSASIDTSQVMTHVRALRDRFTQATLKDVEQWNAQHKVSGFATFIDADTIQVGGLIYQAKSFIIAVGSTPNINAEWKILLGDRLITSNEIFELPTLPNSLAVIGSGVIALELAQAMHRLGVHTTMFTRSQRVGTLSSPNLQQLAQHTLSEELDIRFQTLPHTVSKSDHGVRLHFEDQNPSTSLEYDYLLMATGRQSLLNGLKLENIDPSFKELKNLPISFETKQLGNFPIFVVGDAFTDTPIQHEAALEGKTVVQNCLNYPHLSRLKTLTPLGIVFTQPEMVIVGKSFKQLNSQNIAFVLGYADYSRQGRALVLGKNQGAVELYIDKASRKLLGAELFVEAAEHLGHLLAWVIDEELTIDEILQKPFYHPTLEEGLRTALKHARRQLS